MMTYAVYTTHNFDKESEKLEIYERERLQKIFLQLRENPYAGDQLRYKFFREKRIDEKRVYYLVYDDLEIVLMAAIGGKKTQQKTINFIIRYFGEYRKQAEKLASS